MTVFLYIRLSSADDDLRYKTESESISHQRDLLRQFVASRREFEGAVINEFVDDGYSGTNDARPSFERMIGQLKEGKATTIICKDFSRFFRDYTEIGDYLERIFPFLGVRFISVNDHYDSDDYKGTTAGMEVVMKYIIYSWYSKDLSQKIKVSLAARKKKGEFVASLPPYGYMKDPDNKNHLIPEPESSQVVRRIFDMALEGTKPGDIARALNQDHIDTPGQFFNKKFPESNKFSRMSEESHWTYFNVNEILDRLDYTGAVVSYKKQWKGLDNPRSVTRAKKDWIIVRNRHEAIVSEREYNKVQGMLNHNNFPGTSRREYPLRSLVCCGVCRRRMCRQANVKHIYYECNKSNYAADTQCPVGEKFYEDELEKAVINSLRQMLTLLVERVDAMEEAARKTKGSVENLRYTLRQLEKSIKQNNLARNAEYEKYSDGLISREDYIQLKNRLSEELSRLNEQRADIEEKLAAAEAAEDSELSELGSRARQFLKEGEVTNQMLLAFIERVYVYSGMRIEIKYRFSDELMNQLTEV